MMEIVAEVEQCLMVVSKIKSPPSEYNIECKYLIAS